MYRVNHVLALKGLRLLLDVIEGTCTDVSLIDKTIPKEAADWASDALDATFHSQGGTGRLEDAVLGKALSHGEVRAIVLDTISAFTLLESSSCK